MHEFSIIENIFKAIEKVANEKGLTRIHKVKLQVGLLRQIEPRTLQFAFDTVSKGTFLENAILDVDTVPIIMYCNNCTATFEVKEQAYICPDCEGMDLKLLKGKEIILESIEGDDALWNSR